MVTFEWDHLQEQNVWCSLQRRRRLGPLLEHKGRHQEEHTPEDKQ